MDGRLVGNWFREGTEDYVAGRETYGSPVVTPYWAGHLAIAYDHVDPEQIRISIGTDFATDEECHYCIGAYGVRGNIPDPAEVSTETGLVKYELVGLERVGSSRQRTRHVDGEILGIFLVQILEERTIKAEVFKGKTATEVSGFSDSASLYHR